MEPSESVPARLWERLPVVVRAVVSGLAVLGFGILPWPMLLRANLQFGSSIPWAVPIMAAYLAVLYLYLAGRGWPRTTSAARRLNLRARALPARVWLWSLVAGGWWAAGLLGMFFMSLRLGQVSPAQFDEYLQIRQYPAIAVVCWLVMSAVVAGAVEEAAFRGYMQVPLERRYGPIAAIVIVGGMFFLAHFAPLAALPEFALAAFAWGLLAYWSGSIWPGVIVHSIVDTISFLWAWSYAAQAQAMASTPVWKSGPDASFYALAGGVLVASLLAIAAYAMLAKVTSAERQDQEGLRGADA